MSEKIKITFLGTAGAMPTVKRNHSSILISYKKENILVDCGEGTQRQFKISKISPLKITKILITHWHGDHVLGIAGLFQTLAYNDYNKTLLIYGPRGIKQQIKNVIKAFPTFGKIKFKTIEITREGKFYEEDDFYLESAKMTHGIPANAYVFFKKGQVRIDKNKLVKSKLPSGPLIRKLKEGKNVNYKGKKYLAKNMTFIEGGKKISFVFDTSMNKKIKSFVKDSDLLILESTYSEELSGMAKKHKHMTAKQDAEIAKKAKVGKLFLTHLSERYEKNPEKILKEAKKVFKNSHLAKDFDVISI